MLCRHGQERTNFLRCGQARPGLCVLRAETGLRMLDRCGDLRCAVTRGSSQGSRFRLHLQHLSLYEDQRPAPQRADGHILQRCACGSERKGWDPDRAVRQSRPTAGQPAFQLSDSGSVCRRSQTPGTGAVLIDRSPRPKRPERDGSRRPAGRQSRFRQRRLSDHADLHERRRCALYGPRRQRHHL